MGWTINVTNKTTHTKKFFSQRQEVTREVAEGHSYRGASLLLHDENETSNGCIPSSSKAVKQYHLPLLNS